jgi:hypothetical protein
MDTRGNLIRIPAEARDFSLLEIVQIGSGGKADEA